MGQESGEDHHRYCTCTIPYLAYRWLVGNKTCQDIVLELRSGLMFLCTYTHLGFGSDTKRNHICNNRAARPSADGRWVLILSYAPPVHNTTRCSSASTDASIIGPRAPLQSWQLLPHLVRAPYVPSQTWRNQTARDHQSCRHHLIRTSRRLHPGSSRQGRRCRSGK